MKIPGFFKTVPTWPVQKVRDYMDDHDPGEFNLIDVRQPGEYEGGHLPGSSLIPLPELEERLSELDPSKPTVVY